MSDFSDRPLVAGSVVGLRTFRVDSLCRLTGVSHQAVFKPGVNEAVCNGRPTYSFDVSGSMSYISFTGHSIRVPRPQLSIGYASPEMEDPEDEGDETPEATPPLPHVVASMGCACGYYAYFDGKNDYLADASNGVAAVVEGTGVCTVGTRGFRASKAELLALVIPRPKRASITDRLLGWKLAVVATAFSVSSGITSALSGHWVWVGVMSLVTVVNIVGGIWNYRNRSTAYEVASRPDLDLLAAHYPGVPVYPTVNAALAAHPLTTPEKPTPETCDDFWTRSA